MKLEEGLYAYLWSDPYENNCNTYLIKGDMTVLIDPGHSKYLGNVFTQMEKDGLSSEQVQLVIITHSHPDHFEGVEAFQNKPVRIAMGKDETRYLRESGGLLFEVMGRALPAFRIDFYLKEGKLRIGKETFQIFETPGHSPGSICLYWPAPKVLLTGDVIFYRGVGRTDFPEGDPESLKRSIERMARLEAELLLPGHGEMIQGRDQVLQNFQFIRQHYYPYL